MATEQGYSNQKKKGKAQFKTIHSTGSNSYAEPVVHKSLYAVTNIETVIDGVTDVLGANGQVEFWQLLISGHSAQVGGIVRLMFDSTLPNFEFEVISIVDSDNLLVLPISETKPEKGSDTCIVYGWVSAIADSNGNPQVSISPAPIQFLIDGLAYDVSKDTFTPANSRLLPTENLIAQASLSSIDGKFTTLNAKDFATSAKQDTGNSSLSSIDGKFTTLNAKDFATQATLSSANSTLSSIDGKFTTLNAKDFATSAKQDTGNTSLSSIDGKFTTLNAKDFATTAKQDTGNSSLSSINTNTTNIPNTIATEGGAQPSHGVVTMGHTGAGTARHILVENTGRQVVHVTNSVLPTGGSTLAEQQTQTTALGTLTALFPTSIGTKTSAASLSVVLASDQVAIGVTPGTSSGTITNIQKTVGLTAVRATVSGSAPGAARKKLMIKPSKNNTGAIYLGSSSVTISSGLEIIGPDRLEFELDASDYYLISDTAAQVVEIIEVV
jgi:hypothetical protein